MIAMEKVEKVIARGETEGAREKKMEAAIVRRDKATPAYSVAEVSEGEAIRGDVEEPFDGNGGCKAVTDKIKARYPVTRWYMSA